MPRMPCGTPYRWSTQALGIEIAPCFVDRITQYRDAGLGDPHPVGAMVELEHQEFRGVFTNKLRGIAEDFRERHAERSTPHALDFRGHGLARQ